MNVKVRLRLNPDYPEWHSGNALHLMAQTEQDQADGYAFGRWSIRAPLTKRLKDGEEDVIRLHFLVQDPIEGLTPGTSIKLYGGFKCIAEGTVVP